MYNLPDELLDHICSFLGREDLWTILQLSSRFRRLATPPYLSRFGISKASIQSGTLELTDSLSPLPIVARIKPIQRLVCFSERGPRSYLRYQTLAYILSETTPIPDIVLYDRCQMLSARNAAWLLSCVPSSANNKLLVVNGSSMRLSRPRSAPPIHWILLPSVSSFHRLVGWSSAVVFGIFILPTWFLCGVILAVINVGMLFMRAYRRLSGPPWSQEERIILDAGTSLEFSGWMRIQTLPGRLTLVTLTKKLSSTFVLGPIRGLPLTAFSSLLASLDLGVHLRLLKLETRTDLIHSELMAFMKRHSHLTSIHVELDALRSSSLTKMPMVPDPENKVFKLIAPSSYIPYLLPAAPNANTVSLLFTPVPKRASTFRRTTFDLVAYRTALTALTALPGTHPLVLTLTLSITAASLPWLDLPDAEAMDASQYPETLLVRVNRLWLSNHGHMRFCASDIRALVRWLGLFPTLQRLTFSPGAIEKISAAECAVLAQAICGACTGINTPQDIDFYITGTGSSL
ncbi:hypothetical protein MVEN_02198700 [Mycena venus]|uniref:F-box domain-containing protein n=1 Tax=Mycena venus TaxID=2733690 RepID=A0A8H7CF81_9AGAR|nr:hypothetical protein MVEN_02198700 [Mycena venus]